MIITVCAWCGIEKSRIEYGKDTQISHGICEPCKDRVLMPLRKIRLLRKILAEEEKTTRDLPTWGQR